MTTELGSTMESAPDRVPAGARTVAFFGHDANESTIIKRATAFQANGSRVIGFMFRRARGSSAERVPSWQNVDLGTTVDRNYLARLPRLLRALAILVRERGLLRQCDVLYARNIDMLLLAVVASALVGRHGSRHGPAIVYECLDVQRVFIGSGLVSRAFRWMERLLLARSDLLVVSSPDFISRYFAPIQKRSTGWWLLENKVFAADGADTTRAPPRAPGPPWVIGWLGTLRCRHSLRMLAHIADAAGDRVAIRIHGRPSLEDLTVEEIEAACRGRSNMVYAGPYRSPADLPLVYGPVHFSWCIDLLDAGSNSDWLIPNRIYEGCLMGAVALARKGTATARKVDEEGLGWSLPDPLDAAVGDFIASLDAASYLAARERIAAMDRGAFADLDDTRKLLLHIDALARGRGRRPLSAAGGVEKSDIEGSR
jgi:succinoglycan biosynthesis protein ExoL